MVVEEGGGRRGQRAKLRMKAAMVDEAVDESGSDKRRVSLMVCLTRLDAGFVLA